MAAQMRVQNNRIQRRSDIDYRDSYINGNTVRHVQAVPRRSRQIEAYQKTQRQVSANTQSNRERALSVNASYVVFMLAICIALVVVTVNYLQLQAAGTTYRNTIASMEMNLSNMKLANDNAYEQAMSSVDMEEVKKIAINELGMRYAEEGQIITYNSQNGDYIRQYEEITGE